MNEQTPTILQRIIHTKIQTVAQQKQQISLQQLERKATDNPPTRGFTDHIKTKIQADNAAVIAEIKRASPSKGLIREHFDPVQLAHEYAASGATCLSVLTEEAFFQGNNEHLIQAHSACQLPIIRKDFIVDPYQVVESKALGADCILLIAAAFNPKNPLYPLHNLAIQLGLDVLIEVHNLHELEQALSLDNPLIGINNRNLHTFDVQLKTTWDLLTHIPDDRTVITESGIHTPSDVQSMLDRGVQGFLVGEAFMRDKQPGRKLQELFNPYL